MATVIRSPGLERVARRLPSGAPGRSVNEAPPQKMPGSDRPALSEPRAGKSAGGLDNAPIQNRPATEMPTGEKTAGEEELQSLRAQRNAVLERAEGAEKALLALREQLQREQAQAAAEGYRQGAEQARAEVEAEQAGVVEALRELLQNLGREKRTAIRQAEAAAVEIAFAALANILGRAGADLKLVEAMVRRALQQISAREGLVVHLSPADCRRLRQWQEREQAPAGDRRHWWAGIEFAADEAIECGGCRIESRAGSLDARLELQMNELKRRLLEVHSDRNGRGE